MELMGNLWIIHTWTMVKWIKCKDQCKEILIWTTIIKEIHITEIFQMHIKVKDQCNQILNKIIQCKEIPTWWIYNKDIKIWDQDQSQLKWDRWVKCHVIIMFKIQICNLQIIHKKIKWTIYKTHIINLQTCKIEIYKWTQCRFKIINLQMHNMVIECQMLINKIRQIAYLILINKIQ